MQKMSPNQILTNANLYVIQWRWSVHKDENKMTEWQTIMMVGCLNMPSNFGYTVETF